MKKVVVIVMSLMNIVLEASVVDKAVNFIATEENFVATPYICPGGQRTIGYGCTDEDVLAKGKVTKDEAKAILKKRVELEMRWLKFKCPNLNNNQLAAVTSLLYNLGRTKFSKSMTFKCLVAGNYEQAKKEWAEFRLSGGKVSNGLVARRTRELALFDRK
jgi:GH24 family phage-related lysozyme (muramidase)